MLRFLLVLALLHTLLGCQDTPASPAPSRPRAAHVQTVLENVGNAGNVGNVESERFEGCHFDPVPMLAIFPKQALLDGLPVDEAGLEAALRHKRALDESLGGDLKNQIVIQVAKRVPEKRVRRFLSHARRAGFIDVTRLSDLSD